VASTFYADNYASQVSVASDAADFSQVFKYTLTAAFVINDLVYLSKIPSGVIVLDYYIVIPDLDSSTGVEIAVGTAADDDFFVAPQGTIGQAAGVLVPAVNGIASRLPVSFAAAANMVLKVTTAASGTPASSGVIKGYVRFQKLGYSAGV
jgi:hypothetical protein